VAAALCYVVCALVWSTTWFSIRVCIGPGGYPTYAAAAMRFTIAALILLAVVRLGFGRPVPRTRRQFVALAAAGVLNGIGYACVYRAEESLPGGLVAVLFGTYPLFTALGAALTGTEQVKRIDLVAAALSLVGMAILFWDRLAVSSDQALGITFAVFAVLFSVGYNLIIKREASALNPLSTTAGFLTVASAVLWVPGLAEGPGIPLSLPVAPTIALLYLALFGTVIAFACYFYLLKRVRLMTAATLVLIQPVIALLVDAMWEDQVRLTARSYAGAAVTFAGVAVGITWKWRVSRRPA
jgi:drug/metabolite transporter (DMT)-like permease